MMHASGLYCRPWAAGYACYSGSRWRVSALIMRPAGNADSAVRNRRFQMCNILITDVSAELVHVTMGLFESKIAHAIRVGDLDELRKADDNALKTFREGISGWNALHYAAQGGHPDVVREICRRRCCDVNATSNWALAKGQQTALHVAVVHDKASVIPALVENGASWRVEDQAGWAPMAWAVHNDSESTMRALLHSGVDVNAPCTKDGSTPLMRAVLEDNVKAAQALLGFGTASPACRAEAFSAALAADSGREGIVHAFLGVRAISSSVASAHITNMVTREARLTGELEILGLNMLRAEADHDRLRHELERHRRHGHAHDHHHHRDHHRPGHSHKGGQHHGHGGGEDALEERLAREVRQASAALAAARTAMLGAQSRLSRIRALIGLLSSYAAAEAGREAQAVHAQAQAQQAQAYAAACQRAAAPTAPSEDAPVSCSTQSSATPAEPSTAAVAQPSVGPAVPATADSAQTGADAAAAAASEDKTCPICLENMKNTALVPCGHVLCGSCVSALTGGAALGSDPQGTPCPICRKPAQSSVRIFM